MKQLFIIAIVMVWGCKSEIQVESERLPSVCDTEPDSQACSEYKACLEDVEGEACAQAKYIDNRFSFLIENDELITNETDPLIKWTNSTDIDGYQLNISRDALCQDVIETVTLAVPEKTSPSLPVIFATLPSGERLPRRI